LGINLGFLVVVDFCNFQQQIQIRKPDGPALKSLHSGHCFMFCDLGFVEPLEKLKNLNHSLSFSAWGSFPVSKHRHTL
jgi:hypothetical protein